MEAEDPRSHLVSVSQTVTVRAPPEYRGNVSCRASQGGISQERRLRLVPLTASLSSSRGLLALSLSTSCLLLIIAAALLLLGLRRKGVKVESEAGAQPAISYIDLYSELHHQQQSEEEESKPFRPAVSPPPAYSVFHCQHSCFTHHLHHLQP